MSSSSRSSRLWKQQTRLNFEPLPTSSPAKEAYNTAVQDRLATVHFEGSTPLPRRMTRSADSAHNNAALPTPEPSSQPQAAYPADSPSNDVLCDIDEPPSRGTRVGAVTSEDDEDEVVAPSSKRRKVTRSSHVETPTRRSASQAALETPRSSLSTRRQKGEQTRNLSSSPPVRRGLSIGSPETSGDEALTIMTKAPSRRKPSRLQLDDPFVVFDRDYLEDDDAARNTRNESRGKNKGAAAANFVVDDDEIEYISSDEDDPVQIKQRRSGKSKKKVRSRREQDELDNDLNDLRDSEIESLGEAEEDDQSRRRTRGGPVMTQRSRAQKHLEVLRRRRAGERIPRAIASDEDPDEFDDEDGVDLDQVVYTQPIRGYKNEAQETSSDPDEVDELEQPSEGVTNTIPEDEDEDGFVVEDEDDTQRSRGALHGIPLAFTNFASSKPRELFVHAIEWLVKNKIAPAFSRNDELYDLSWNKIDDQIKAQAGSRLISSAWGAEFKYAVLARPQMQVNYISTGDDEFFLDCDACNKTNHPARYQFKFSGHAYHPDTLEPIEEDENFKGEFEDPLDEDNDTASYDQAGHLLSSSSRTFNLGRFCAANAEMGHKLTHWKYHLNQALLAYLEEQGVLSTEAILAREKFNKKKREREAEAIIDTMQDTGVIQELWRDLQNDLEDARFGMEDHVAKNGGRRNKNRIGKVRVNRGEGRIEEWSEGGRMKVVVPSDSEGE